MNARPHTPHRAPTRPRYRLGAPLPHRPHSRRRPTRRPPSGRFIPRRLLSAAGKALRYLPAVRVLLDPQTHEHMRHAVNALMHFWPG